MVDTLDQKNVKMEYYDLHNMKIQLLSHKNAEILQPCAIY